MQAQYTAADTARITGGRLVSGDAATVFQAYGHDSRRVTPGMLYVAIAGERVDGRDFAAAAVAAGAVGVLVTRPVPGLAAVQIVVDDTVQALGRLAAHHLQRVGARVVAVTGSVGKTTTKEMIHAVLSVRLRAAKTPGNLNSEIGLPLSLLGLAADTEVVVLEMAMRGAGEIAYLCRLAPPDVAVVTNVGLSHLELLGSVAAIAAAKAEIVAGLRPGGAGVLNADDPRVRAMADRVPGPVIFYALPPAAGQAALDPAGAELVTARAVMSRGELGQHFTLVTAAGEAAVQLAAVGRHSLQGALAAAAVARALGFDPADIAAGLSRLRAAEAGRLRILHLGGCRVLDDTYNAAPDSMCAALAALADVAAVGRTVAVLGDMYELGEQAVAGHRRVGAAAAQVCGLLITVGNLARHIAAAAVAAGMDPASVHHLSDKAAVVGALPALLRRGDTILVKGSRGMAMEEIVAQCENILPRLP